MAEEHPGGPNWFGPSMGRDISAVVHTYHRGPARLWGCLARYEAEGFTEKYVLPEPGSRLDTTRDLPRLAFRDQGGPLAPIRGGSARGSPSAA